MTSPAPQPADGERKCPYCDRTRVHSHTWALNEGNRVDRFPDPTDGMWSLERRQETVR